MRRPRFFSSFEGGQDLTLEGDEHTHLSRVLRLAPGRAVEVFDGEGGSAEGEVVAVERRHSLLRLGPRREEPAPQTRIGVAVALPKPKRTQRLIEALTELDVTWIRTLVTERSATAVLKEDKVRRWTLEASKQCQRNRLPAFGEPLSLLPESATPLPSGLLLLGDTLDAPSLQERLAGAPAPAEAWVFVGPEGGFTPGERERLIEQGVLPVSLGRTILRIETAAISLVAGLRALLSGAA